MECLSFDDIDKKISDYNPSIKPELTTGENQRWQKLQEFRWARSFAEYLKRDYQELCKEENLEDQAIDIILRSKNTNIPDLSVQLIHANEYDMRRGFNFKNIDVSGNCIVGAAVHKCRKYCDRKVNTKEIILLIQGVDESTKIEDLVKDPSFLRIFESLPCFRGIYYITDRKVHKLKNANFD